MASNLLNKIKTLKRKDSLAPSLSSDSSQKTDEVTPNWVPQKDLTWSCNESKSMAGKGAGSDEDSKSFAQSVTVLKSNDRGYKPYAVGSESTKHDYSTSFSQARETFLGSSKYRHNISNPNLRMLRTTNQATPLNATTVTNQNNNNKPKESQSVKSESMDSSSSTCSSDQSHGQCIELHNSTFANAMKPVVLEQKNYKVERANETQELICKIFWMACLGFSEYQFGKELVKFVSLWPTGSKLDSILDLAVEKLGQREAVWDLCDLVLADGPATLLRSLLDKSVMRVDSLIEGDGSLLHLACVLQNMEAIQVLTQYPINHKLKDRSGNTADMVCFNSTLRKQLPKRYQHQNKSLSTLSPCLQDKEDIFKLAATPNSLYDLQKKLQMFQFPINDEKNRDGDFLIHIACRTGICQLPLLLSLRKLQNANVNLCNTEGLTPLMIVARAGDSYLCDTLMCLFGADPNQQNSTTNKTALHYATEGNHAEIVNCLIKRGADVNIEDKETSRPDDALTVSEECRQIIQFDRTQRSNAISQKVKEDTLYPIDLRPTDLTVVDDEGYTLLMIAAMNNRIHNLEVLLQVFKLHVSKLHVSPLTINAQHGESGLTALALAAKAGHHLCCEELLRYDACPGIKDMKGQLALHHAVLNNHESVVDMLLKKFPAAYTGLYYALRICRHPTIHDKLNKAWEKRQDQIVLPVLRICAMEGDAGKLYCTLEEGDYVNAKSDLESQPAMFYAVENSHVDVLKLLLERGLDLKRRDVRSGNTVLHVVSQTGNTAMTKFLLGYCGGSENQPKRQASLDVNAMNNDRKTPLQICAEKGFVNIVKLFIENGATTAILNKQGTLFTSPEYEGARILIEACRNTHTELVMKLVADKSKKALKQLEKVFLPRFDHNLRNKLGDTPLMVACRNGRLKNTRFLLQSAVYANLNEEHWNPEDASLDAHLPPWKSHDESRDELVESLENPSQRMEFDVSAHFTRSLNPNDLVNTLRSYDTQSMPSSHKVSSFLHAVERPKGLFIFHDSVVSHVCAVNLFDGNTPLHRCIEGGDHVDIVQALLNADRAVVNIQNDAGLSPVHMACQLGRKKTLKQMLGVEGVDLGLVTLKGKLPEEFTENTAILEMILKAKEKMCSDNGTRDRQDTLTNLTETNLTESLHSIPSTGGGSTINFGKIDDIFQSMKIEQSMKTAPSGRV
ncbi:serine/threonine-protein phosphatase 6 regulatory ankyrin repeat subunit B-like isoform X2 [Dreissena polymorpha]|uniref:serine/threonine-protein phosphatase 6 regulatory ankyrin repeat subunit B-like isoform X2 n=1 Tax=Dreissena polymorpha TaxID=45954 RepID=UPI0022648712|nr:serine/threonine-protein phosphatase 6 regulatory ankyrin repeat subunit B-like isoform X2 [Dreissena polymorpha]XP_052243507.1 serine/threonine-protein phosphatase 6 regulatory ankyrin repeat subunit B-like isoform X2 [Dreissena polymorpha]XP_052243518.1 serine/threonine-protein phosphatase 6 regulatory ankyrin repeat subunit B-like isoform X2 [Dreissena polymorpha]